MQITNLGASMELALVIFVIKVPYYGQLTAVKARYPLTRITWPYCGLRRTAHRCHVFFKLTADQVMVFSIWSRAQVFLNYIFIKKNIKKWQAPLLDLAKKVLNILLSAIDWFHYLISEKVLNTRQMLASCLQ